jgi:hypothetical protein
MQQKMRQTAEVMAPSHADNSNTVGWSNATTAEGYQQLQLLNRKTVQPSCSNATILGTQQLQLRNQSQITPATAFLTPADARVLH